MKGFSEAFTSRRFFSRGGKRLEKPEQAGTSRKCAGTEIRVYWTSCLNVFQEMNHEKMC